jgi:hypothetical protein
MKAKVLYAVLMVLILASGLIAQETNGTRGRRAATGPTAEATVTINEQFLNSFLTAMFDNLNEPAMPLTIGGAQSSANCASEIRLKRENASTRTAVSVVTVQSVSSFRSTATSLTGSPAPTLATTAPLRVATALPSSTA